VYGLKEKNLAKTYIKLISLGMRDPDAIRLLNWKKPTDREVWISYNKVILPSSVYHRTNPVEKFWRFPDGSV